MNKTEQLNELFDEWQIAQLNESEESLARTKNGKYITKDFFQCDGIINESEFDKEKLKVLFISAEANADKYNGKEGNAKTDYRVIYQDYKSKDKKDYWKGKMKEGLCGMYLFLTKQNADNLYDVADKFAVMDLNKRGGTASIGDGNHLIEYTKLYQDYILKEISIINPDIIVLVGINLCKLRIAQLLGCKEYGNKCYLEVNGKEKPILLSLHTANVVRNKRWYPPLAECRNESIGVLCYYLKKEIDKYGVWDLLN